MMHLQSYDLPEHWAPYFVNGDASGLEDEDQKQADAWFDATFPKGAHCVSVDVPDGGDFRRYHDASNYALACNVATYTFDVIQ
ncbi:MAG TPA: hypothetical protein VLA24_14525 [Pseudomonadales bacterium]|nr:hypothetical protein [Pseudomonadales bacterium]